MRDMIEKINESKQTTSTCIHNWNPSQLKNYRLASEIDRFLFFPIESHYKLNEFKGSSNTFSKHARFMNELYKKLLAPKTPPLSLF